MSYNGPKVFRRAVEALSRLPGIGEKTAQRLAFHLIHREAKDIVELSDALLDLKSKLQLCTTCFGLADEPICPVCKDPSRDSKLICVVEDPSDLFAIEGSGQYRGVYHVLHGSLAPLDGIGPSELKMRELTQRAQLHPPREVILATDPDVEGEATALYLAKLLHKLGVRTSRIAMGIPLGGHLEYTDRVTLGRAIAERRDFAST